MGARYWLAGGRLGLARVRVSRVRARVAMETAQVAGTLVESRGGTSRTASEVAGLMHGWNATGQAELRRSGSIWGLFNSRLPLRWGEREPARAGPALNPRHVGVAMHHRQPGLMLAGTAAGQAELGRSGIIWCLFDSRCPLRWRERGHAR